ncbi:uncharacterized protein LOC6594746 [Drosophila persimilis]|uniref:uncharacterized protein LOC6594746 n=1 Tax=Drosophila persimilis TaxID=7234 RepID=UPI000F076737|nr:uncharacterized protein LOC6594746 [Drosophila persimilis]
MEVCSKFEFTNIQCTSLDKEFDDIEYCYIKSVNRSYKYISIKVKLFKTPVTKVKVNAALYQRLNGYKPFLYNITLDACKFLRNTDRNPVAKYIYELFNGHSNMNHTCPFDHDIILEKLPSNFLNTRLTDVLPFPEADYLLETHWYAYNVNRAVIKVYGTLS